MEVPQKIKNRVTISPRKTSLEYLPEDFENFYSQRYIHPYVHWKMETTAVSFIDDWIKI